MKDDIEDLKAVIDQLLIETTVSGIKLDLLKEMVLAVFDEILTEKETNHLRKFYYDTFAHESKRLDALTEMVFDQNLIVKEKERIHFYVQESLRQLKK